jgi:hypothetical protein
MSLDFNYAKCDDKVLWDENDRMRPEVESIIWHTMFLGQNKITEENWRTFYCRYVSYRIANGQGEPYFSLADVKGMIGLHTNASTITEAAFKKDLVESLIKTAQAEVDKQLNDLGIL